MRKAALLVVLALALVSTGCDRYRHRLRDGTLSEVAATSLRLYGFEGKTKLAIGNEAGDGTCLTLRQLRVTIDGVAQSIEYPGGRDTGQTKGSIGPVDKTDWCDAARVTVSVPDDPARASDVVDVTDGTTTLHAEFPNVLAKAAWAKPPPAKVIAGKPLELHVRPTPSRGTGKHDAENFARIFLGSGSSLPSRPRPGGALDVDIPSDATRGPAKLMFVSSQREIAARACSAKACNAESELALSADVDVVGE